MKKFILISSLLFLSACMDSGYRATNYVVNTPTSFEFENLFYFKEVSSGEVSGPIELVTRSGGSVDAYTLGKLRSKNFNGTFGTHPNISFSKVMPVSEGRLIFSKDVNYSSTNDLEKDGTTHDLGSGKKYTVYDFSVNSEGLVELTITIHSGASNSSGGINDIVVVRKFKEVR